ncbi:hypothetical protein DL764_003642 [Monosporascus ibericus]|uniref:Non-reducing end beta-L-arabinofuranosidase-like GH127 catalytic domain-containing protein n=1 Tax=Monosporascus ibericus TaxID=155417 RepID=A0A4Q4THH8_9PEZI|nr:hypothetical protein DL764_003642 [Monosporascus ibericus]
MLLQPNGFSSLMQTLSTALLPLSSVISFSLAAAQIVPPVRHETGVSAYTFDLSQVQLTDSRWLDNQDRTLSYLKSVDVERLLYNFRANHGLSTNGASRNGGWDAPDFPFRSHMQGHFLTAWSQCWATLRDTTCRDRAKYFTAELAKCQANNNKVGFGFGYLSGFPESEFTALERRTLSNGNVPYYAIHKTLAGLLDVWRHIGDTNAESVLLSLAEWVYDRTGKLSYNQMQNMMSTEFGGMNDVLAEIYYWNGDSRWLETAQRFDHAAVFDPLAADQDRLNGLHANTQVPKWIGAAREYKQTGTTRYRNIAKNAWDITVHDHTYAIGGNSQAEHFRNPDAIAAHLTSDTCQQNPSSSHGHVTYFTPLNPGGRRGVGPAWGGGTWSTDYDSFWCCQGTGLETNTKFMDSIYAYDNSSLYINLFTPSKLNWSQRNTMITQTTNFPVGG